MVLYRIRIIRITTMAKDVNCFDDRNVITEMERNRHSQNRESLNANDLGYHSMFLFNSWKRKEVKIIKNWEEIKLSP